MYMSSPSAASSACSGVVVSATSSVKLKKVLIVPQRQKKKTAHVLRKVSKLSATLSPTASFTIGTSPFT